MSATHGKIFNLGFTHSDLRTTTPLLYPEFTTGASSKIQISQNENHQLTATVGAGLHLPLGSLETSISQQDGQTSHETNLRLNLGQLTRTPSSITLGTSQNSQERHQKLGYEQSFNMGAHTATISAEREWSDTNNKPTTRLNLRFNNQNGSSVGIGIQQNSEGKTEAFIGVCIPLWGKGSCNSQSLTPSYKEKFGANTITPSHELGNSFAAQTPPLTAQTPPFAQAANITNQQPVSQILAATLESAPTPKKSASYTA